MRPRALVAEAEGEVAVAQVHEGVGDEVGEDRGDDIRRADAVEAGEDDEVGEVPAGADREELGRLGETPQAPGPARDAAAGSARSNMAL
jgi:hypothetical protein